ncbi:hypothetical protein [Acidithiobacillus ferrianus]|uniref:hypothetical protein n=1 Tax=Acidithiobacillus ferrianus TaxID=2678518 RepID=UPI0034E54CD5
MTAKPSICEWGAFCKSGVYAVKVVDMDLQAFFDRVNHDRLMARLKSRTRGNTIGVIVAELRKALLGWKAYFGIAEVLFGMAAWLPLGFALDISPSLGTKLAV